MKNGKSALIALTVYLPDLVQSQLRFVQLRK
jgi:hypothetical protein